MKIAGENITFSDLFDSKSNKKSLAYGLFGFTHFLLSALCMGVGWLVTYNVNLNFYIELSIMSAIALYTSYHWLKRETKGFTISLFKERSTPFVTLDTRLDFFTPCVGVIAILALWVKYNV